MKAQEIKKDVQKMLFSLQNIQGVDFLIATVFISGMGILKVNLKLPDLEVTGFEKKSFMEMVGVFQKKDVDKKK